MDKFVSYMQIIWAETEAAIQNMLDHVSNMVGARKDNNNVISIDSIDEAFQICLRNISDSTFILPQIIEYAEASGDMELYFKEEIKQLKLLWEEVQEYKQNIEKLRDTFIL